MPVLEPVGGGWPVDWPVPVGVGAWMTTRFPGHSTAAYAGLNLAEHVRDDPLHVEQNRRTLARQLGVQPTFLRQVHGTHCVELTASVTDGLTADACTTREPGLACTVMVADCLPVLFCNGNGTQVAAAHAGWRGLLSGVLDETVRAFGHSDSLVAWLGPCIGPTVFEVGPEVRSGYLMQWGECAAGPAHFLPLASGKFLCHLPGLARLRLQQLGVQSVSGNDGSDGWCTVSNPARWFSHRRDGTPQGGTGRMAACVWIRP